MNYTYALVEGNLEKSVTKGVSWDLVESALLILHLMGRGHVQTKR